MKKSIILTAVPVALIISLSACSGDEYNSSNGNQIADCESFFILDESMEHNGRVPDDNSGKEEMSSLPGGQVSEKEEVSSLSGGQVPEKEENSSLFDGQEFADSSVANVEEAKDTGYSIITYTEAPNQNSSINIQYPFFEGEGREALNNLILGKVQEFARIDGSLFPEDSGLTVNYQAEVTLQNAKMVSIVFWGTSSISGGTYETTDIIPFNIDVRTMKEILFEDLYVANKDFQKVFFEKAYFPTNPVTSCDEAGFAGMLQLQSPEYQSISPFSISGNVRCFLKQNALVLSMPSVHAAGSDHFEAQINYDDLEDFYLLEQKYWE